MNISKDTNQKLQEQVVQLLTHNGMRFMTRKQFGPTEISRRLWLHGTENTYLSVSFWRGFNNSLNISNISLCIDFRMSNSIYLFLTAQGQIEKHDTVRDIADLVGAVVDNRYSNSWIKQYSNIIDEDVFHFKKALKEFYIDEKLIIDHHIEESDKPKVALISEKVYKDEIKRLNEARKQAQCSELPLVLTDNMKEDRQATGDSNKGDVLEEKKKICGLRDFNIVYEDCSAIEDFHDPSEIEDEVADQYSEGKLKKIMVNSYERNGIARTKCIEHYGCFCQVCGLHFENLYGAIGKGFIHVHHKNPLSDDRQTQSTNPETDLVPLCPNCHSMIHQKQPPYTVDELREIMRRSPNIAHNVNREN